MQVSERRDLILPGIVLGQIKIATSSASHLAQDLVITLPNEVLERRTIKPATNRSWLLCGLVSLHPRRPVLRSIPGYQHFAKSGRRDIRRFDIRFKRSIHSNQREIGRGSGAQNMNGRPNSPKGHCGRRGDFGDNRPAIQPAGELNLKAVALAELRSGRIPTSHRDLA